MERRQMKILSMAWTIYDESLEEFCQNYTGGCLVIKNICEYIGRIHKSYLFIGRFKLPELKLGNIHIVDTISCPDVEDNSLEPNEIHLRTMAQAFEIALEKIKPDIVNFHGIGELVQLCIKICVNKNIPYVYTEHLFIELGKEIEGCQNNIKWEKGIYNIPSIKIIAVSTGMKKKILQNFPHLSSDDIYVIKNGTDFCAKREEGELHNKYRLDNKKVLLCVGTINSRKNQCQIIRAFQLLPLKLQNKIKILFCGKDRMNGILQDSIENAKLKDKLIYAGAVSNEDMKKFYSIADGLIMPSLAEGLSIAALETITYGLPVIMFSDSECADDLDDDKIVCFAKDRTDSSLADAIIEWSTKKWDRDYIIEYSKQFSMEKMAENYIAYYRYILTRKKNNE